MRCQLPSGNFLSACTKAPVSCSGSQSAVVSQARSRTIRSPQRTPCPGWSETSRERPLRLLSTPITATRSAIGVSLVTGGEVGAAFLTGAAGAGAALALLP